jgi:hypothetical protein
MEVSEVRKRVRDMLERARQADAERRVATDAAGNAWERIRDQMVAPLARQVAQVLRAEGYGFQVFTPAEVVRLSSERSGEDFVELGLDAAARRPSIVARINRGRGREVISDERVLAEGPDIEHLDEEQILAFLLDAMMTLVQR